METLVIGVLAALQLAGLGFALLLFTDSISGVTRTQTKRAVTILVNVVLILTLLGMFLSSYGPMLYFYVMFR